MSNVTPIASKFIQKAKEASKKAVKSTGTGFNFFYTSLLSMVLFVNSKSLRTLIASCALFTLTALAYLIGSTGIIGVIAILSFSLPLFALSLMQYTSSLPLIDIAKHKEDFTALYNEYKEQSGTSGDTDQSESRAAKTKLIVNFAHFAKDSVNITLELKTTILSLLKLFNPIQISLLGLTILGFWVQVIASAILAMTILL